MSRGNEQEWEGETGAETVSVLVVEDEVDDARFALDAIESEGFDVMVEVTPYGERGLELANERDFDCVLLDYRLPRMDGTQFVRQARDEGLQVPIIILTGRGSKEVRSELLDAGADAYLTKEEGDDARIRSTVLEALN